MDRDSHLWLNSPESELLSGILNSNIIISSRVYTILTKLSLNSNESLRRNRQFWVLGQWEVPRLWADCKCYFIRSSLYPGCRIVQHSQPHVRENAPAMACQEKIPDPQAASWLWVSSGITVSGELHYVLLSIFRNFILTSSTSIQVPYVDKAIHLSPVTKNGSAN